MNPMQAIQMLRGGTMNPQQLIMNAMGNNNPIANNLINMINNKDNKGIENFARNICKERGIDFDKEFTNFKDQFM